MLPEGKAYGGPGQPAPGCTSLLLHPLPPHAFSSEPWTLPVMLEHFIMGLLHQNVSFTRVRTRFCSPLCPKCLECAWNIKKRLLINTCWMNYQTLEILMLTAPGGDGQVSQRRMRAARCETWAQSCTPLQNLGKLIHF